MRSFINTTTTYKLYFILCLFQRILTLINMYKKFQKLKLQGSNDGVNWFDVTPFEFKRGDVIEEDSKDCGGYGGVTQNRWVEILGEYLCINNDKYKKLKKQYLDTATGNWVDVEPLETMQGELIEKNSEQCGYAEQWVDTDDWGCKDIEEPAPTLPIVTDDVSFQKALRYNGSVLTYFYIDGTFASEALPPSTYKNIYDASYIIDFGSSLYSLSYNVEHSHVYMGKAVYLPATETIIGSVFEESKVKPRLQSVYLPNCSYIGNFAFMYCSKLKDIYLNRNRVVQFGNVSPSLYPYADLFNFCGSSFKIHVPSSLYSIYISRYSGVTYHYSYPNSDNPLYDLPLVDRFVGDL